MIRLAAARVTDRSTGSPLPTPFGPVWARLVQYHGGSDANLGAWDRFVNLRNRLVDPLFYKYESGFAGIVKHRKRKG